MYNKPECTITYILHLPALRATSTAIIATTAPSTVAAFTIATTVAAFTIATTLSYLAAIRTTGRATTSRITSSCAHATV